MAIRKAPTNGSTRAGAPGGRDLISLSLAPVRQGLSLYAEINRSILDTFFRFIPGGMSSNGAASERNGVQSAAVEPVTAAETRSSKRPAEPSAVKRSTATKRPAAKPVTTKRPATTKAVANRRTAPPTPRATGKSAAPKRAGKAAPKPAGKAAPKPAAKSARVKPSAAKKVASSRPRGTRTRAGKKA